MKLFFQENISPTLSVLPEEESKHCVRVLRMHAGDTLHLTDGAGTLYTCRITDPDPRGCGIEIVDQQFTPPSRRVVLAVAPTKNADRYEWFVEKATELGISRIVPILCTHSERRTLNLDRTERVIVSAMKQSLNLWRPKLSPLTPFADLIKQPFEGDKFIAHCGDGERQYLPNVLHPDRDILIFIGPEGDFAPSEVALAVNHGFIPITLGTQRLRTETAAIVASTIAVI